MTPFQKYLRIFLPVILALTLVSGVYLGIYLSKGRTNNVFVHPQPNKLSSIINYISQEYVDTVDTDDLIEEVIPILIENLDPHSIYIPAKDLKRVNEPLVGNFEGIGVQFKIQNDTIAVVKTIINGPSYKVGILDGDRIVTIDDSIVAGVKISEEEVMQKLRGDKGTKVKTGILRKGNNEVINFIITRDRIPLYSVDVSFMVDSVTGYIKISKFAQTTYTEFIDAVTKLNAEGLKNLIVDLRSNSGGYMDAATNIADEFLPAGKLIVYTEGKARPRQNIFSTSNGHCINNDVIVLIDEWSASASEILAGAIQDNDRGIIVGRRSFGKGLVQEPIQFKDGSALRLTIARYYTPTGRSIQKPYNNGTDEYNMDIGNRFHHGEFEEKDSIQLNDSLKYYTPGGNVVYGGGGIMPDIFVPFDTTGTSPYFTQIARKGLMYNYAFDYADMYRNDLNNFKSADEIYKYLKQNNIINRFFDYVTKKGIAKNEKDIKISHELIENQLYALIARNILDNEGFYPILLKSDNTFKEAYKTTIK